MKKSVLPNILQQKSKTDVIDCSYDDNFRLVMNNELSARASSFANAESKARARGPDVGQIEASIKFPSEFYDHPSSTKSPNKSGWFRRLSSPLNSIAANLRNKTPRLRLFGASSESDDDSEIVKKNRLLSGLTSFKKILQEKTWKNRAMLFSDTPVYEFEEKLSYCLSPTDVEPYPEVFEESDSELNRQNLEMLNMLPQFSEVRFDEHFNLRDCCSKAMTRDNIGLLLHGTMQPYDSQDKIQEHLYQIYSKIFLSPGLCHKVVQKAVADNFIIDIIYKRRVRRSGLFTIASSFEAEFPSEVHFFCVSLDFIFYEDCSKEKEAAGWVLRAIIYQILHSKVSKQIFSGSKLSGPNNSSRIYDLSFLCKLRETHSAIYTPIPISPKTGKHNQTSPSVDTTHTNVNFSGSVFKPVKKQGKDSDSSVPFIAEPPQRPEVTVHRSQHVFRYLPPVVVMSSIAEVEHETDHAALHDSIQNAMLSDLNQAVKKKILFRDDNKVVTEKTG